MRAIPHAIEWSLATPITSPRLPCMTPDMTFSLQTSLHDLASFLRGHNRHDLEFGQIAPVDHPFLQQTRVTTLHQLKASIEIRFDPAPNIPQAVGHHPSLVAKPAINRFGITIAKPFDHHEQHFAHASSRLNTTDALVPPNPNEFDSTQPSATPSRRSRMIGMSAKAGSRFSILALSQMKPLLIIRSE